VGISRVSIVEFLFVLVADRGAVDNDRGSVERFLALKIRLHSQLGKSAPPVSVYTQSRALLTQGQHLRAIREKWGPFMESDLVNAE
jgi:hypothetical protein